MNLELFGIIFEWGSVLFAFLTFVLIITLLYRILSNDCESNIKKLLIFLFIFLSIGYLFYAFGEFSWLFFGGVIPDFLFIIGYAFEIFAFSFFIVYFCKMRDYPLKCLFGVFVLALILMILPYFFVSNFILNGESVEGFYGFILYFYPMISVFFAVLSFRVYLFFRQDKVLARPFLLLFLAGFSDLIAEPIYSYIDWNEIFGILGVATNFFYMITYILTTIAFYLLVTKWAVKNEKEVKKE